MIFDSYAITNPWTMVIHPPYALLADLAMMSPYWLYELTLEAIGNFCHAFYGIVIF